MEDISHIYLFPSNRCGFYSFYSAFVYDNRGYADLGWCLRWNIYSKNRGAIVKDTTLITRDTTPKLAKILKYPNLINYFPILLPTTPHFHFKQNNFPLPPPTFFPHYFLFSFNCYSLH